MRGAQARLAQALLDAVEEGGVHVVGELHLDLGPGGGGARRRAQPLGPHRVDAHLGEQRPVLVEQMAYVAGGEQPYDGGQRGVADAGAQEGGQGAGDVRGQGCAELVADAGGDGELEVPARVVAARSAAQGEGVRGQAQVRGVVVDGVQLGHALVDDAGDARGLGEVGEPDVVAGGFVLPLDLALRLRHELNLDANRDPKQSAGPAIAAGPASFVLASWPSAGPRPLWAAAP